MAQLTSGLAIKALSLLASLALAAAMESTSFAESGARQTPPVREINVTSDSEPGWLPSIEQSHLAEAAAKDYLAAADSGNAESAYQYFSDLNKQNMSFDAYKSNLRQFNAQAGPLIEHQIVKVTWTKNSPSAPIPGVYAAIDLASRYANVDRDCGYLILYQPPPGGDFRVMREETNMIDNTTAASIAQMHSRAALDQKWAELSANCPNYAVFSAKP